jgi:hypothetical protein
MCATLRAHDNTVYLSQSFAGACIRANRWWMVQSEWLLVSCWYAVDGDCQRAGARCSAAPPVQLFALGQMYRNVTPFQCTLTVGVVLPMRQQQKPCSSQRHRQPGWFVLQQAHPLTPTTPPPWRAKSVPDIPVRHPKNSTESEWRARVSDHGV